MLLVTGLTSGGHRKKAKAAGVWTLLLEGKPATVLRDVHSVGGTYLLPIALRRSWARACSTPLTVGTVVHEAAEAWVGERR